MRKSPVLGDRKMKGVLGKIRMEKCERQKESKAESERDGEMEGDREGERNRKRGAGERLRLTRIWPTV